MDRVFVRLSTFTVSGTVKLLDGVVQETAYLHTGRERTAQI
jgi:hypothetical protein